MYKDPKIHDHILSSRSILLVYKFIFIKNILTKMLRKGAPYKIYNKNTGSEVYKN